MTMCPRCLELYSEIWSKPCCKCADKTIPVDIELINVVQMLLTRGFDVSYATCYPDCFLQVQIPEICRQKWRILHLRFGESCRLPGRIA